MAPVAQAVDPGLSWPAPKESATDPYAFYRKVGTALAAILIVLAAAEFLWNLLDPTKRDFISFWGAAQLAMTGDPAAAYDNATLRALQASAARFEGGEMPFAYPPAFLLLVLPFGLLSYPLAMAAWVSATFVPYLLAVRRMFPDSGLLAAAFPAAFANAVIGQNAFVTAALFIFGLALLPRRPFAGGLLLGCLILKPQLGLLLPLAFVAAGQWRAIAGAALSAVGVLLLGLVLFGPAASTAWIGQMPLFADIARDGLVGWDKLVSVYSAARQAGAGEALAFALHAAVALVAAVATWRVWRSQADWSCKAAVLCTATLLTSPYLFVYDILILVAPLLWLARKSRHRVLIAVLWCVPAITIAQLCGYLRTVNLIPMLLCAVLLLCWEQFKLRRTAADTRDKATSFV